MYSIKGYLIRYLIKGMNKVVCIWKFWFIIKIVFLFLKEFLSLHKLKYLPCIFNSIICAILSQIQLIHFFSYSKIYNDTKIKNWFFILIQHKIKSHRLLQTKCLCICYWHHFEISILMYNIILYTINNTRWNKQNIMLTYLVIGVYIPGSLCFRYLRTKLDFPTLL